MTTLPCPTCQAPVEPPRVAWFAPGDHPTACPNGHEFVVHNEFTPDKPRHD